MTNILAYKHVKKKNMTTQNKVYIITHHATEINFLANIHNKSYNQQN